MICKIIFCSEFPDISDKTGRNKKKKNTGNLKAFYALRKHSKIAVVPWFTVVLDETFCLGICLVMLYVVYFVHVECLKSKKNFAGSCRIDYSAQLLWRVFMFYFHFLVQYSFNQCLGKLKHHHVGGLRTGALKYHGISFYRIELKDSYLKTVTRRCFVKTLLWTTS